MYSRLLSTRPTIIAANHRCKEGVLVPVLKGIERGALNRSVDFADCPSPRARD
jgi:hypothetical protein